MPRNQHNATILSPLGAVPPRGSPPEGWVGLRPSSRRQGNPGKRLGGANRPLRRSRAAPRRRGGVALAGLPRGPGLQGGGRPAVRRWRPADPGGNEWLRDGDGHSHMSQRQHRNAQAGRQKDISTQSGISIKVGLCPNLFPPQEFSDVCGVPILGRG